MASSITLTVPKEYGYVLLTATSSFILSLWANGRVSQYRAKTKIRHPQQYVHPTRTATATDPGTSPEDHAFNCAQRGYGNLIEAYPSFLAGLLVSGLEYPKAASALGALWVVSRVFFAIGYMDPKAPFGRGRFKGVTHHVGWIGVWGLVGWMGVKMVLADA